MTGNKFNKCPICSEKTFYKKITTPQMDLYRCSNCSLIKSRIKIIPKKRDYYDFFELSKYQEYYEHFRKKTFKKNWQHILGYKRKGKGLDIGASMGWFIDVKPGTWMMQGTEKYKQSIPLKYRKIISSLDIYDLKYKKSKHDLITMWNVIEHLPDPNKALSISYNLLNDGGIIGLSFPNRKGFINRIAYFLNIISFNRIPQLLYVLFQIKSASPHLYHYDMQNMHKLLIKNKFNILYSGGQPIIDVGRIDKRLTFEGWRSNLVTIGTLKALLFLVVILSNVLAQPDELVIYGKKV